MCTPRTAAISSARRPSSVSRIARARSASPRCSDFDRARNVACSVASAVSVDFPGMPGLHSSHPRQIIQSIAHSQAVCLGEQQLKNILRPVRGYRVMGFARKIPSDAVNTPPLPDKPSIAVLAFTNIGDDSTYEYLSDGIADDIITA